MGFQYFSKDWAMVLKKIDGQAVNNWQSADRILRGRSNQHKPLVEFEVALGRQKISFIYGQETAEYLSNGRYIAKQSAATSSLIYDDEKLSGEEKRAVSNVASGLTDLFNRYRNHLVRQGVDARYYDQFKAAINTAKSSAYKKDLTTPKYRSNTWKEIYAAFNAIDKQLGVDRDADGL